VHRVLPSSYKYLASSQRFQFHWYITWDSRTVVTSLKQVGTYPTRDYATLGPSELQPPFTEIYIICVNKLFSHSSTGQMSDPIFHFTILQSLVFLLNSRYSRFASIYYFFTNPKYSFSRSYRINLPSSLTNIFSIILIFSINFLCQFTVRLIKLYIFLNKKKIVIISY